MKNANFKQIKTTTMKKDFKQFFIQQTGQSLIKQSEFQQIDSEQQQQLDDNDINLQQNPSNKSSDNQFQQIDSDNNSIQQKGGIKSAQFWSGIKMPSYLPYVQQKQKQSNKLQIRCALSTGFNSLGRDNIFYLHENNICKATGCVLIYDQQIYPKHSKKITTISYNQSTNQILTATQGSSPELFLWKFHSQHQQQQQQLSTIEWTRKYFLGKKCEDIYAISFFNNDYIIAVEKFTLHKSSSLHVFDKLTGKKLATLKVGKFYDLELLAVVGGKEKQQQDQYSEQGEDQSDIQSQGQSKSQNLKERLFFANDQGISQLIFSSNQNNNKNNDNKLQISTNLLYQSKSITCLCPFYCYQKSNHSSSSKTLQILTGDKQGKISLIFNKQQQKQIKVHNGWIFQIKHKRISNQNKGNNIKVDYFFSLGAIDSQLAVLSLQNNDKNNNNKLNILHIISLSGYGRSIQISYYNMLLIGKRDGSYQQFSINQLITQITLKNINRNLQQPSLKCFQSKLKQKSTTKRIKTFIINLPDKGLLQQGKKRYAYANTHSKSIRFFTIQNGQQQVQMNSINDYALRAYPQTIDITNKNTNNLLAYTYDIYQSSVSNNEQKNQLQTIKSQSFSSLSSNMFGKSSINNNNKNKGEKLFQKSILVIQNYQTKQLVTKIQVRLENDNHDEEQKNKCTVIKFSPSGRYLAMGDDKGWVFLYQINKDNTKNTIQAQQQQQQLRLIKCEQKLHKYPIQQLIWSNDQKYIKSTSVSQLYYWQLQNSKQKNTTFNKPTLSQCKPIKLRDTNWLQLSKFSWQTKPLWQKTSFIDQYYKFWQLSFTSTQINQHEKNYNNTKQITTQKRQIILASTIDGCLRVYNNYPPQNSNYQQLKLNDQPFQLIEYLNDEDSYSFIVVIQGMVMVIQLSQPQEYE